MALFGASLPEAYAAARGARVLNLTGGMVDDLVRRVNETAQMIIDAMGTEGGIRPGESGYNDIRRVRLMHAAVRHLVLNDPSVQPPWDRTVSVPLNQEDLLGTLMTFTQIVFGALSKWVSVTNQTTPRRISTAGAWPATCSASMTSCCR